MAKKTDAETEQIKRLLPAATGKQVKDFVKKLAQKDPGFRSALCAWLEKQFVPKGSDSADDLKTMVEQIFLSTPKKTIHYSRWESERMVDWHTIAKKAAVLMDSAEDMLKQGKATSAATLAMDFLEQTAAHIDKGYLVDECEYDLPDVAERAAELLETAMDAPDFTREEKLQILPRLEAIAPCAQYSGLHLINIKALVYHLKTAVMSGAEVLAMLDAQIAQAERESEKATLIRRKQEFLCTHGREAEVPQLLKAHLSIPEIRRAWVEYLAQHGNYEEAMQAIEEGIRLREKAQPGDSYYSVSNGWLYLKKEHAEQQHDLPRIIEADRSLFLDCCGKTAVYFDLKKLIPAAEWPAFSQKLIRDVTSQAYYDTSSLASIYLEEGQEEKVVEILRKGDYRGLDFICRFAPKLSEKNVQPFIEQFREDIKLQARRSVKREDYKMMVDYLRRMRQAHGGEACVAELVAELRRTYYRRPAMLEELDKL